MRNLRFNNLCSIIIMSSILLLSFSSASYSQSFKLNKNFEMQSVNSIQKTHDELSDYEDSSQMLTYLSVAVVVGLLIYVVANSNSDKAESENTKKIKDEKNTTDVEEDDFGYTSPLMKKKNEEEIPINVYLGIKRNNNQFSDNTFQIGVSYNF